MWRRYWNVARNAVRRYFVAGLLAFAPIAITIWAIAWIIRQLDGLMLPRVIALLFPNLEQPPSLPPLVGLLFTFVVILLSGVLVRHFFGHELVRFGERLLSRVPVARSIYNAVKQLFEALVSGSDSKSNFNSVVLVEYPRRGIWGIAFVTGYASGPLKAALDVGPLLNCFIPTTPNPTSGFYLLVPEADVVALDITVEDAFKAIMSAGLVTPVVSASQPGLPGIET